jgi:thiamine pyrophosphate-dependent acetolactate synthase large subunit-like protein
MAYGYARTLARPAIVTATEGPGVTNLATGIAAAFKGYVPIISISGAQELWLREKDASQDIDQVTFNRPITKWAYSIPTAGKVQEAVRRAFRVALTEPLGPVHLDVSKDILLAEAASEPIAPEAYRPTTAPACASADLDRAAELIARAERPLFLVGGGVLRENVLPGMKRLAEATGIPAATLQYYPDAFPTSHPLSLGPLGRNGYSSANRAAPQADVVIALGAHLDLFSTGFKHGIIRRDAKLIHHSAVASNIGIVFPVSHAAVGSTGSFIEGLSQRLQEKKNSWLDVAKLRADWNAEREKTLDRSVRPMLPTVVAHAFMYISDWGSVGAGLPIAMGVKLARPKQVVMAAVGDMGMMCNIGELETAVREKIPVVCVVYNDRGLGNERAFQKELYGGRFFAVDYNDVDFGALARGFGAHGERVLDPSGLAPALKRAIESGLPAVIDVPIHADFHAAVVSK